MTSVVLNVNDHAANLYMVSRMLRGAGWEVREARCGREALEMAATSPHPAVIVLDVNLPDMTGFEVCRQLKMDPRTKDIKILHTSASLTRTENKVEGLEAGADGYLTQPFEPRDLTATVHALIRLHNTEADLQARNEALISANQRKDEFLAMLAHELRNPLAAIQMGLPLLQRFPPRDALEAKTVDVMQRQTGLLIKLVDDLLDAARVTQGRIELNLRTVDLVELTRTVAEGIAERVLTPREQPLTLDLPRVPILLTADPVRIEQILTNLLDNASKYSDGGTRITVSLRSHDGVAELSVRDEGIGIEPALLPSLFELFAQATTSLARSSGGLGIGLTLVKALAEMHGGTVTATSDGLGRGSVFTVRIPVSVRTELTGPLPTIPVAPLETFKILVIDDNEDGRYMLRCLCELDGHEVVEAGDGYEGVQSSETMKPDIAFVDIGLPGIDGYEVARRLRERFATKLYLVALSGYGSPEHRERAFEAGFDEHIAKPMEKKQLARVVDKVRQRATV